MNLRKFHCLNCILYNKHLTEINDDPNDLIGPAVDNLQEVDDDESDDGNDNITQEEYEHQSNWMLLSEMMPNR